MNQWQRAASQHAHAAWSLPLGIHLDFQGKRVNRDKAVLLVSPNSDDQRATINAGKPSRRYLSPGFRVLVWPHPIHFSHFEEAAKGVRAGGPADRFPGAVGSVRIESAILPSETHPLEINQVQSHFRTTETTYPLPRKLANKYKKWRLRAFEELLRIAKERGVGVKLEKKILYYPFRPARSMPISRAHDDLIQAAAKVGFTIKEKKVTQTTPHKYGEIVLFLTPKVT